MECFRGRVGGALRLLRSAASGAGRGGATGTSGRSPLRGLALASRLVRPLGLASRILVPVVPRIIKKTAGRK